MKGVWGRRPKLLLDFFDWILGERVFSTALPMGKPPWTQMVRVVLL